MSKVVYLCDFCDAEFSTLETAHECEQQHAKLATERSLNIIAVAVNEVDTEKVDRIYIRDAQKPIVREYVRSSNTLPARPNRSDEKPEGNDADVQ